MRRCNRVGSTVCCLAMAGTALWISSSCLLPVCLQTDTCCGCTEQRWRPTLGASALMAQYSDVRSIALLRCRRWDSIEAKQGHQQAYLNSSWCKAPGSCILAHATLDLVQQFHYMLQASGGLMAPQVCSSHQAQHLRQHQNSEGDARVVAAAAQPGVAVVCPKCLAWPQAAVAQRRGSLQQHLCHRQLLEDERACTMHKSH